MAGRIIHQMEANLVHFTALDGFIAIACFISRLSLEWVFVYKSSVC